MRTEDPLDIVSSTADAAFATDEDDRIVIWNHGAEQLLGYEAARVLGRTCHDIICGKDVFGNRFCDEHCSLTQMIRRHEALHHFEMDVRKSSGETLRAMFSVVVVPGPRPTQFTVIHILRPVERSSEVDGLIRKILTGSQDRFSSPSSADSSDAPPTRPTLTGREIEILRLMADGQSTQRIADSLFISTITVRNHIQHILQKLKVHSKLEAVSIALRERLI